MFTFESFELVREALEALCGSGRPLLTETQKFASSDITQSLLTYVGRHREFTSPEEMKRVVSLLHRQAVGAKAEGLFFQVSRRRPLCDSCAGLGLRVLISSARYPP